MPRILILLALLTAVPARAQGQPVPDIHVVLFTARGLSAPAGATDRLADAALYAEKFFLKWMKHWGYPPAREEIFSRTPKGKIRVLTIRGDKPGGEYDGAQKVLREVWGKAHTQYKLPRDNPIWWVWVYNGNPPARFSNYRGSGDLRRGGWGVVNYTNLPGSVSQGAEMAAGFLHTFTLKGCVHELGHGLGLPHIGPKARARLGNSLMGPRTDPFRKIPGLAREDRVYLSKAAAAMLHKHFVFSGTARHRSSLPGVRVTDYNAAYSRSKRTVVVTGKITTRGAPHSVVLFDDAEPRQKDYWRKSYVAKIEKGGKFTILVDEPSGTRGVYRLMFCFNNGAVSGKTKTRDLKSAFAKRYAFVRGQFRTER